MSRHGQIEDGVLLALDPLKIANGGPFRQINTFSKADFNAAVDQLVRQRPPLCLIISHGMAPTPLRSNAAHDETYTIALLIAASNIRGQQAARRGAVGDVGLYDLLDVTHQALLGYRIPAIDSEPIEAGKEALLTTTTNAIVWRQDWKITRYL